MADKDAGTPRVFLIRHGQTEWTINGRWTGTTELDLTATGREQVLATGPILIGPGKLLDPAKLAEVFVSPRSRAQQTADLLFSDLQAQGLASHVNFTTTEALAEWNYGAYEGLTTHQIYARREEKGLDSQRPWNIWTDGCEGGEYEGIPSARNPDHDMLRQWDRSADAVTARLDVLISAIRDMQAPSMHGEKAADVVLISHGHLLRALVKRWLHLPMETALSLMHEPGGIGILSYQHHNVQEPALLVGMAFPSRDRA
ncbi:MAG: hypothetical protein Q9220_004181 [cf. Caloplaca sp. 1 TL-2023]